MGVSKKYGFDIGTGEHATWNNEADAFKHTYMGADLVLKMGQIPSLILGIIHENQTPNNPQGEWNMDSWNNNQGREIAREIKKEYGSNFEKFTQKERENIIADKVMQKMKNGELITHPDDNRKYEGWLENAVNNNNKRNESRTTGQAAPIEHIFSPQEIGKMTPEEFSRNEKTIMEQLKKGQILSEGNNNISNIDKFSPNDIVLYTREDIDKMTTKEFAAHEKDIMKQMQAYGIPYNHQLSKEQKTYGKEKQKSSSKTGQASSSDEGKWVTINGNHVLIKD